MLQKKNSIQTGPKPRIRKSTIKSTALFASEKDCPLASLAAHSLADFEPKMAPFFPRSQSLTTSRPSKPLMIPFLAILYTKDVSKGIDQQLPPPKYQFSSLIAL